MTRAASPGPTRPGETGTIAAVGGLSLPRVVERLPEPPHLLFAVTGVAANGRIAGRSCVRALDWTPSTRLQVTASPGVVSVTENPDGEQRIDADGHLRLLTTSRRVAGFRAGERLLLV